VPGPFIRKSGASPPTAERPGVSSWASAAVPRTSPRTPPRELHLLHRDRPWACTKRPSSAGPLQRRPERTRVPARAVEWRPGCRAQVSSGRGSIRLERGTAGERPVRRASAEFRTPPRLSRFARHAAHGAVAFAPSRAVVAVTLGACLAALVEVGGAAPRRRPPPQTLAIRRGRRHRRLRGFGLGSGRSAAGRAPVSLMLRRACIAEVRRVLSSPGFRGLPAHNERGQAFGCRETRPKSAGRSPRRVAVGSDSALRLDYEDHGDQQRFATSGSPSDRPAGLTVKRGLRARVVALQSANCGVFHARVDDESQLG